MYFNIREIARFTESMAKFTSSLQIVIIYIIILIHVSAVLLTRKTQDILPDVRVDLDFCYSVTYYTHFLGEIKCASNLTYKSQVPGSDLIHYSSERGWYFEGDPFICMCSCNFNTEQLRNGNVLGNNVISHGSYLNYTCHAGFKKTVSSKIICLDGIFVSESESVNETSVIFRAYPSHRDFRKESNCVHEFVDDPDSWICNDNNPLHKEFVYKNYGRKVPYRHLSNQGRTCYKNGHVNISHHSEISCILNSVGEATPVDSVHQSYKFNHLLVYIFIGAMFVLYFAVGIVMLLLKRRKVSKALQKQYFRERDHEFSHCQQESAPTSSVKFCIIVDGNKYSTHLSSSGELYPTEHKILFYSKKEQSRIACQLTPNSLRKNFADDFPCTIHSKYLDNDSDDEILSENSERPTYSNVRENKNSWSRGSKSESDVSDEVCRDLYRRSHSDSIKPFIKDGSTSACVVMEDNNERVFYEDENEKSSSQLQRRNESVIAFMDVMNERTYLDHDFRAEKIDVTVHPEDNDERETVPLMTDMNDMKHNGSSVSMLEMRLAKDDTRELKIMNRCTLDQITSKSDTCLFHLSS